MTERVGRKMTSVAVRSNATAGDLPDASFAGQLESFLDVRGEKVLLERRKRCCSPIGHRLWDQQRLRPMKVALSVGAQTMVRSDSAARPRR